MPDEKNSGKKHKDSRPKPLDDPRNPNMRIIGYTGNLNDCPTVYFNNGHYTLSHPEKWNVGWESCENWVCMFFGNVLINEDASSHYDPKTKLNPIPPIEYVQKLEDIGANKKNSNRINGGSFVGGSFVDKPPDGKSGVHKLREFWIRKLGDQDADRFPHPSRTRFKPVWSSDTNTINTLNALLDKIPKGANQSHLTNLNTPGHEWRFK